MRGRSPTYCTLRLVQFDQAQQRHEDEPYEKDGSKLTVSNPRNPSQDWSYVTLLVTIRWA